jgi:hypothetical protein
MMTGSTLQDALRVIQVAIIIAYGKSLHREDSPVAKKKGSFSEDAR